MEGGGFGYSKMLQNWEKQVNFEGTKNTEILYKLKVSLTKMMYYIPKNKIGKFRNI